MARIAKEAMRQVRSKGIKAGLIRPISLWPFPDNAFSELLSKNHKLRNILVVEMSAGQMVEDVKLAVAGKCDVKFYGRTGGGIPTAEEILKQIEAIQK